MNWTTARRYAAPIHWLPLSIATIASTVAPEPMLCAITVSADSSQIEERHGSATPKTIASTPEGKR